MAPPRSLSGVAAQSAESIFVWQVAAQVVGALMTPLVQELTRTVNAISQTTPLTPAQLADMVVRNIVQRGDAEAYAKQSGTAPSDFGRMVASAGEPPAPGELVTALRRGIIPHDGRGPGVVSFEQGIAESRIYDHWRSTIEALGDLPLPVADAVDGVVESQIEFELGATFAFANGVNRENFQHLVNIRGNPPSPTELNELHKRGFIELEGTGPDAVTVQQGIYEGATKNKWFPFLAKLADYLPPPRTVTALIREGSLSDDQGLALFKASGLSQDLATAYVHSAHHQRLAATKELAKSEVDALYHDQLIDAQQADQFYESLGYTAEEAAWLRAIQDMKRAVTAQAQAITRVHNLYVNRKVDRTEAVNALDALNVPHQGRDQLLADWDIERTINVRVLSEAQIADAYFRQLIDQGTATDELVNLGYSPRDAWILLSVRLHAPQPNPPPGVTVPQGA